MEAGTPDRSGLLTALTTEHFTLQSTRAATITESLGRSTIYLGSLSASLVALALIARGERTDDVRLSALVILPALVFLGTATFVRILETGIEDAICAQAINRIRHYYLELAGEHSRYFLLGGHDDIEGTLANMGIVASPWRPFFSVAGVIGLINSYGVGRAGRRRAGCSCAPTDRPDWSARCTRDCLCRSLSIRLSAFSSRAREHRAALSDG